MRAGPVTAVPAPLRMKRGNAPLRYPAIATHGAPLTASPLITLHGAAGEVTGSCTLIESNGGRVLIDFGLFQGSPAEEWRNTDVPPIDFRALDAVIVTHAHVDHCGRLGMLPSLGFQGVVIATPATARLLPRVLRGSATLQATRLHEFETGTMPVARVIDPPPDPNAIGRLVRSRTPPVLYGHREAEAIVARIEPLPYLEWRDAAPGVRVRLHDASHILGSASVELECACLGAPACRVLCTGDLGPSTQTLLAAREPPPSAEIVIMESTNGARRFGATADIDDALANVLDRAASNDARVLMPTFSLGRAQQLLHRLRRLRSAGRWHDLPVYLDSPMAAFAADLHQFFPEALHESVRQEVLRGGAPLQFPELHCLHSRRQSLRLKRTTHAAIILAGSGFCDAGPILHHLAGAIEDPLNEIVLSGHQIEGTLGHGLAGDARRVLIGDAELEVRARRTRLEGLSGHADQMELLDWLAAMPTPPKSVILNHGTDRARAALAPLIRSAIGAAVVSPAAGVAQALV